MTTHELARKLLNFEDLPVTVFDGCDPCERDEVSAINLEFGSFYSDNGLERDKKFVHLS